MYAIIETGGTQYKVSEAGTASASDKVLVVSGDNGVSVGAPYVAGAKVGATVIGDGKAKKVIIYKYKSKKGFHKKKGHRQPYTMLKIDSIAL